MLQRVLALLAGVPTGASQSASLRWLTSRRASFVVARSRQRS